jgi:DNA helicase II / ATP-dependent DNA helicase PcrA
MTVLEATGRARPALADPAELRALMGIDFSAQQLEAVAAPLRPGVIVAGAGSGKTTVMAARVVWLVGSGQVRPDQVLGLTFTNKAAAELGHRVRDALAKAGLTRRGAGVPVVPADGADVGAGDGAGEPTVATYHAYAGRLISEHGLRLGVEPDSRLLADASRFQLAGLACERHPGALREVSTHLPTTLTSVLALDAEMSEHLVSPEHVRAFDEELRAELAAAPRQTQLVTRALATARKRDELVDLVQAYRALKAERGAMDFSDQMAVGARLAQECAEVGALERERFAVVLLDEYQDTSVAQRLMLTGLFSGDVDPAGQGHPVTAVGDPCQGIYGWRGASVANLDEFPQHFRAADGEPAASYPLSVNRRCGARILDVANAHARALYSRHTGVQPLTAPPAAVPGTVRAALFERYDEQMRWVAEQVATLPQAHPDTPWSQVGVLVHRMADARALQLELRRRGVPVEVVGLGGLLARPEVADVVATLEVIHDLTANAAMLRLLTGPRWRIGPRDLALLGARAKWLARAERADSTDIDAALQQAVSGVDVTEIVSLADALDDPGPAAYSPQARDRFAALTREIRRLRGFTADPLVDLVRRVIDTIGVDVELAAGTGAPADQARDNLASFVDAVATFAGNGLEATLPSLLAYLRAEDDYAQGLPVASPTDSNSVKLLTVHKAKGLEWDVVFVPELTSTVFPSALGRPRWPTNAEALPSRLRGDADTLPDVLEWSTPGHDVFKAESSELDEHEERRLGYVAFTRARKALYVSGCWWGPTQKKKRGPSAYLRAVRQLLEESAARSSADGDGGVRLDPWAAEPVDDDNPHAAEAAVAHWPAPLDHAAIGRRRAAADLVEQARARHAQTGSYDADEELLLDQAATVAEWDATVDRLIDEARRARVTEHEVPLPASLSATAMLRLRSDPEGLAREIARPMPRRPSAAARFGTRFHAWVESFVGQQQLVDPVDIPGAADEGIGSEQELRELCQAFAEGPFGDRVPHAIEAPFAVVLAGEVVRGRIDAVYAEGDGFRVVDWKTNQTQDADPLQVAIYRLAWAELAGVPPESVTASFYYVRSGELVTPQRLAGRAELEEVFDLAGRGAEGCGER